MCSVKGMFYGEKWGHGQVVSSLLLFSGAETRTWAPYGGGSA